MLYCLILTENPAMAASLRPYLISRGKVNDTHIAVLVVGESPRSTEISNEFRILSDRIEAVLTDLGGYADANVAHLNPIKQHGWSTVLGMLIL
jgi:hypothetical protein